MMEKLQAQIEALLFTYGEPLEIKKAAKLIGAEPEAIREALGVLEKKYRESSSGLMLLFAGDKAELVTKPDFGKLMETAVKEELQETLTPAALETLAIIAYAGPILRSMIDYIRGVNSSFILRNLLIRGLIQRTSDANRPNAFIYSASFELLKHLGISKLEDLPEFVKFRAIADKLKTNP